MQIETGLQLYGLLGKLREQPNISMKLFSITEKLFEWTFKEFQESVYATYSEDGSNLRIKEVDTFKIFLDAIEVIAHDGEFAC